MFCCRLRGYFNFHFIDIGPQKRQNILYFFLNAHSLQIQNIFKSNFVLLNYVGTSKPMFRVIFLILGFLLTTKKSLLLMYEK